MNKGGQWRRIGASVLVILLASGYFNAYACYQKLAQCGIDLLYIYPDAELAKEAAEEAGNYAFSREVCSQKGAVAENRYADWGNGKGADGLQHRKAAVAVRGITAFNYRDAQRIFSGSELELDVNLLKWAVCLVVMALWFSLLAVCFYFYKKRQASTWAYLLTIIACTLYLEAFIVPGTGKVPVWLLPGKWSDMEGWRELWASAGRQIWYLMQWNYFLSDFM